MSSNPHFLHLNTRRDAVISAPKASHDTRGSQGRDLHYSLLVRDGTCTRRG